jgi:hypothetical protein
MTGALSLTAAVILAIPTVAIDVYNAQDITNRGPGPNFPWTLVIKPEERDALNWLKRTTKPTALVQVEPIASGAGGWASIPAFAQRRTAAGIPISMIPLRPYQEAIAQIRSVFNATTVVGVQNWVAIAGASSEIQVFDTVVDSDLGGPQVAFGVRTRL